MSVWSFAVFFYIDPSTSDIYTLSLHDALPISFTYNDPVIFLEYALDVAAACREKGIKTVAVTAG